MDDNAQKWSDQFVARFGKRFVVLFNTARWLRDDSNHEAAIVIVQTACEVCTEIVLTETLERRGIGELSDPVLRLLSGYNLANPRVRTLYEDVTNDVIHEEPFWPKFVEHNTRRNRVAHRGETATRAAADASIAVVEEVIRHIQQHYYDTWRTP